MLVTLSILSCLACILMKWLFAFRASRQELAISAERARYHSARKVLHLANNRCRVFLQEQKQLEAKIKTAQQNIGSLNRTHSELDTQKAEMDNQIQKQKELLKEMRDG